MQSMPSRPINWRTRPQRRARSAIENAGSSHSGNSGSWPGSSTLGLHLGGDGFDLERYLFAGNDACRIDLRRHVDVEVAAPHHRCGTKGATRAPSSVCGLAEVPGVQLGRPGHAVQRDVTRYPVTLAAGLPGHDARILLARHGCVAVGQSFDLTALEADRWIALGI